MPAFVVVTKRWVSLFLIGRSRLSPHPPDGRVRCILRQSYDAPRSRTPAGRWSDVRTGHCVQDALVVGTNARASRGRAPFSLWTCLHRDLLSRGRTGKRGANLPRRNCNTAQMSGILPPAVPSSLRGCTFDDGDPFEEQLLRWMWHERTFRELRRALWQT